MHVATDVGYHDVSRTVFCESELTCLCCCVVVECKRLAYKRLLEHTAEAAGLGLHLDTRAHPRHCTALALDAFTLLHM